MSQVIFTKIDQVKPWCKHITFGRRHPKDHDSAGWTYSKGWHISEKYKVQKDWTFCPICKAIRPDPNLCDVCKERYGAET